MKRQNSYDNMEVLYPGNLALLSMFLKNPDTTDQPDLKKEVKNRGDPSECAADVLTCGSCQKDFLLADILRFIQHKVHCQANVIYKDSPEDPHTPHTPHTPHNTPMHHPHLHSSTRTHNKSRDHNGDLVSGGGRGESPLMESPSPRSKMKEELEEGRGEEKRKREEEEDNSSSASPSARKKARSVQDAEANTMDTEPARYVCGTCCSVLSSAWGLVQHVQSSHGIIIYQETSGVLPTSTPSTPPGVPKPSHSSPLASVSSTATTISAPMPPLPIPLLDPNKMDLSKVDLSKMVSPATSGATPLPPHLPVNTPLLDPTHPFNLLRMPLGDSRVPFHPGLAPPFVRPGHDFRMDQLLQEGLRLNPGLLPPTFDRQPFLDPGLGAPRPAAPKPINTSGDPSLDFYSQRLRQLAGTTSPTSSTSPKKPLPTPTPPFSSPNGPASSTPAPAQTPTSTRSDSATTDEKPFKCDRCAKSFRWETNLIIHHRIHTGEKDFRCIKCQDILNTAQSLRFHMRSHKKSPHQNGTSPDSSKPQTEDDHDDELEEEEEEEDDDDDDEEEDTNPSITDSMDDEEEEHPQDDNTDEGPEDLSTSKSSFNDTPTSQNVSSSTTTTETKEAKNARSDQPKSVVGELMDKFGLSNISTYSEAYQQALKESGRFISHAINRDGNKIHPNTNGVEKTLKLRDDLTKGLMGNQPSLELAHQTLLGAFDNPYEAQKRIAAASRESSGLYAGLWLPSLTGSGSAPRDLFPGISHSDPNYMNRKLMNDVPAKSSESGIGISKPGTSSTNNTPMSLIAPPKKEHRRNDTCEYCGKIFKNCSNLTVHRRSHTGEKPYKCDLCSYACAQSSKLTRHMKTHGRIGKDVYRCRFCDMPFSVASTLEKHMRKCVVNQNNKGLFPSISAPGHENMDSYKGFHLTSVISDESSKSGGGIFSSHFNAAAAAAAASVANTSNEDTGDSSNLSGAGS